MRSTGPRKETGVRRPAALGRARNGACPARAGHFQPLASRPVRPNCRADSVSNAEKIYSIFEPHTDRIKRGKVRAPIEFGHKVFLAESAQGLITQDEVLKGNPSDEVHVAPSLERHKKAFGRAPR